MLPSLKYTKLQSAMKSLHVNIQGLVLIAFLMGIASISGSKFMGDRSPDTESLSTVFSAIIFLYAINLLIYFRRLKSALKVIREDVTPGEVVGNDEQNINRSNEQEENESLKG